jgi:hypothetical protein
MGLSDLPKYPAAAADEPVASPPGRGQRALPAAVMVGGVAVGLLLVAGTGLVLRYGGGDRPRLAVLAAAVVLPVVAITAGVYERHRRRSG